jgi:hypothetical protein
MQSCEHLQVQLTESAKHVNLESQRQNIKKNTLQNFLGLTRVNLAELT